MNKRTLLLPAGTPPQVLSSHDGQADRKLSRRITTTNKPTSYSNISSRSKGAASTDGEWKVPSFAQKLHDLLTLHGEGGSRHIVAWQFNGMAFKVLDRELFSAILPQYGFKQSKFDSFLRQLGHYGFKRIMHGVGKGGYHHANFHRDHPEWLVHVTCQRSKKPNKSKKAIQEAVSAMVKANLAHRRISHHQTIHSLQSMPLTCPKEALAATVAYATAIQPTKYSPVLVVQALEPKKTVRTTKPASSKDTSSSKKVAPDSASSLSATSRQTGTKRTTWTAKMAEYSASLMASKAPPSSKISKATKPRLVKASAKAPAKALAKASVKAPAKAPAKLDTLEQVLSKPDTLEPLPMESDDLDSEVPPTIVFEELPMPPLSNKPAATSLEQVASSTRVTFGSDAMDEEQAGIFAMPPVEDPCIQDDDSFCKPYGLLQDVMFPPETVSLEETSTTPRFSHVPATPTKTATPSALVMSTPCASRLMDRLEHPGAAAFFQSSFNGSIALPALVTPEKQTNRPMVEPLMPLRTMLDFDDKSSSELSLPTFTVVQPADFFSTATATKKADTQPTSFSLVNAMMHSMSGDFPYGTNTTQDMVTPPKESTASYTCQLLAQSADMLDALPEPKGPSFAFGQALTAPAADVFKGCSMEAPSVGFLHPGQGILSHNESLLDQATNPTIWGTNHPSCFSLPESQGMMGHDASMAMPMADTAPYSNGNSDWFASSASSNNIQQALDVASSILAEDEPTNFSNWEEVEGQAGAMPTGTSGNVGGSLDWSLFSSQ